MLKKYSQQASGLVITFLSGVLLFFSLQCLVSIIPNSAIEKNQAEAIDILESEGEHPHYAFTSESSKLDNFTDTIVIKQMTNYGSNIFKSAMHETYARYWHGYAVLIRPLLTVFSLYQIRYILMVSFFVLFGCTAALLARKTGFSVAVPFMLSAAMAYMTVVATSLEYSPVFFISFLSICTFLLWPEKIRKNDLVFFMAVGMVTNFLDFLTAPIITLGYSLIVFLYVSDEKTSNHNPILTVASDSFSWFLGYAGTWVSKWIIGSLILKTNVITDGVEAAKFRTSGSEAYPLDYGETFRSNIKNFFSPEGNPTLYLMAVMVIILLVILVLFRKNDLRQDRNLKAAPAVAIIGIYPYVWYLVLSNHSMIHQWFTYRSQVITAFAFLTIISEAIDWKKVLRVIKG